MKVFWASYLVHDAHGRAVRQGRFTHTRMDDGGADLPVGLCTLWTSGVAPVRWVVNGVLHRVVAGQILERLKLMVAREGHVDAFRLLCSSYF